MPTLWDRFNSALDYLRSTTKSGVAVVLHSEADQAGALLLDAAGATGPPLSEIDGIDIEGVKAVNLFLRITGVARRPEFFASVFETAEDTATQLVVWLYNGAVWHRYVTDVTYPLNGARDIALPLLSTDGYSRLAVQAISAAPWEIPGLEPTASIQVYGFPYNSLGTGTLASWLQSVSEATARDIIGDLLTPIPTTVDPTYLAFIGDAYDAEVAGLNRTGIVAMLQAVRDHLTSLDGFTRMDPDGSMSAWATGLGSTFDAHWDAQSEADAVALAEVTFVPSLLEGARATEVAGANRVAVVAAIDASIAAIAPATTGSPTADLTGYSLATACRMAVWAVDEDWGIANLYLGPYPAEVAGSARPEVLALLEAQARRDLAPAWVQA